MTAYEILLVLLALIIGLAAGYQIGWNQCFIVSTQSLEHVLDNIREERRREAAQKKGD